MIHGIDISTHNKTIDFEKVKKSGKADFIIIRMGYGKGTIDKFFIRNVTECIRLDIPFGVYWFSYAITTEAARKEALSCIEILRPYKDKIKWGVWFDLEGDSINYAKSLGYDIDANAHAKAFIQEIENAGYLAGNYTNPDFIRRGVFNSEILQYPTWLAAYPTNSNKLPTSNMQHVTPHAIWQYSSRGIVDGIKGLVDLNIAYVDFNNKATVEIIPEKDEWMFDAKINRWWYRYADGAYPASKWIQLEGKWYYFDDGGWMVEGWVEYKDNWYYMMPRSGYMAEDVLLKLDDGMYYIKSDGTLAYTDASGRLV